MCDLPTVSSKSFADAQHLCRYKSRKCINVRARRKDGTMLRLCEYHRKHQNEAKKRSDLKLRDARAKKKRVLSQSYGTIFPTLSTMDACFEDVNFDVAITPLEFSVDDTDAYSPSGISQLDFNNWSVLSSSTQVDMEKPGDDKLFEALEIEKWDEDDATVTIRSFQKARMSSNYLIDLQCLTAGQEIPEGYESIDPESVFPHPLIIKTAAEVPADETVIEDVELTTDPSSDDGWDILEVGSLEAEGQLVYIKFKTGQVNLQAGVLRHVSIGTSKTKSAPEFYKQELQVDNTVIELRKRIEITSEECVEEKEDTFEVVSSKGTEYENLMKLVTEARAQKADLQKTNVLLQKNLVPLLQKKQDNKERKEDKLNSIENEKRYLDCLTSVHETSQQLRRAQAQYDRIAMDLQGRLDEKEYKANEISESFAEFKREVAKGAENSRTGKPIPRRVITQFEAAEAKKDQEIEKVRLKNINLRTHLKKLEQQLRAKEQLAEGLHLIDFEQLKIENQTLNEKIEERNEDLHKLRKKTTDTVQVLTHIKEKLQFVQVENHNLKKQLGTLDDELTERREHLTTSKRERDVIRTSNAKLKQKQGFSNSDLLVQDYEARTNDIAALETKRSELTQRLAYLTQMTKEAEKAKSKVATQQLK